MGKYKRLIVPDIPHHLTQRGIQRRPVFFGDGDYAYYRSLLAENCHRYGVEIWSYCLMPNHVHLIAVPGKAEGLSRAIGETHRRYARLINHRHEWSGHLWQGRFASFPMDESHLIAAARYVELNPVRAGLTETPEDWRWSSARAHLMAEQDILVKGKDAPLLEMIGDWSTFLGAGPSQRQLDILRKCSETGRPAGNSDFIAHLENLTGRVLTRCKRGPKPRVTSPTTPNE